MVISFSGLGVTGVPPAFGETEINSYSITILLGKTTQEGSNLTIWQINSVTNFVKKI